MQLYFNNILFIYLSNKTGVEENGNVCWAIKWLLSGGKIHGILKKG